MSGTVVAAGNKKGTSAYGILVEMRAVFVKLLSVASNNLKKRISFNSCLIGLLMISVKAKPFGFLSICYCETITNTSFPLSVYPLPVFPSFSLKAVAIIRLGCW